MGIKDTKPLNSAYIMTPFEKIVKHSFHANYHIKLHVIELLNFKAKTYTAPDDIDMYRNLQMLWKYILKNMYCHVHEVTQMLEWLNTKGATTVWVNITNRLEGHLFSWEILQTIVVQIIPKYEQ